MKDTLIVWRRYSFSTEDVARIQQYFLKRDGAKLSARAACKEFVEVALAHQNTHMADELFVPPAPEEGPPQ